MEITKRKVFTNMIWRFLERVGAQLVSLIVNIILARLLSPNDYGTIALVMVFVNILSVFIDSGLGNALIQKKNADDLDFSTVFYINVSFCIILYLIMFLLAPIIAKFYNNIELTKIIRVVSILLIISGLKNVQQAFVSKNLQFKKFFFSTLIGTIIAAFVGILMAFNGYGCWALVTQYLVNAFIDSLVLIFTVKWRPKLMFSFNRLKLLFSYGWKILASGLLDAFYVNIRKMIIGKKYTSENLAFYNKGELFPFLIIGNINSSINSVLFPTMSEKQNDLEALKNITRRTIKVSTYCIAPLLMGLAACAKSIVPLILTEKWNPCIPFMYIYCLTCMFYPIHTANLSAIQALGRSDIFLKLEIIKKVIGIIIVIISMWFGVMAMAYSLIIYDLICQIINSWPNKKLLNYKYSEQFKDISRNLILAVLMGCITYSLNFINFSYFIKLIIQIPTGIFIYVILSIITKNDSFYYLLNLLKKSKKKYN